MSESAIQHATLADIEAMHRRGELHHDADAPVGDELGEGFWDKAALVSGPTRFVQLQVEADVLDYFVRNSDLEEALRHMQAVLRDYVQAQRP